MSAPAEVLLDASQLRSTAARLAAAISEDHPSGVVLVGVLNGCVCFLADLCRQLSVACQVDFLALSSFSGSASTTRVRVVKDLELDVSGSRVVLVEDIVDTGLSASYVVGLLQARGAAGVEVCTLLDRTSRRIVPLAPRYVGSEAPEAFLVGYGLDFAGRYRNLRDIHVVDAAELERDGAAYDALLARPRPPLAS